MVLVVMCYMVIKSDKENVLCISELAGEQNCHTPVVSLGPKYIGLSHMNGLTKAILPVCVSTPEPLLRLGMYDKDCLVSVPRFVLPRNKDSLTISAMDINQQNVALYACNYADHVAKSKDCAHLKFALSCRRMNDQNV